MWLTRLFVQRPALVFVMLAFVTIAGLISYRTLVQQQTPNVDLPTVTITVNYPGASPTEMRDNIVRPIEDQLAGAPDLNVINSTVQLGRANISAIFNLGASTIVSLQEVQRRLQAAQSRLPNDLTTPTVQTFNPSEPTVVFLGATARSYSKAGLSQLIQNSIIPAVEQAPGVANVNAYGIVNPAIEVTIDPVSLLANNLTLNDVVNTIANNNQRLPGGIVYQPTRETTVDIRGDVQTPEQVTNLPLQAAAGLAASGSASPSAAGSLNPWSLAPGALRIGDVASVSDGYETQRVYSYVNGKTEMYLAVQKATEANEVDTAKNVIAAIPRLEAQFPGVRFTVIHLSAKYTEQQINAVFRTLLEGVMLTSLVLMLFLGSWRAAIVVLIAIPTSLLITLTVMKLANFTIDTVSLLAMTLVIGILVDDSIVVLENIERHHKNGDPPLHAAVNGRSEIGLAAIVITMVDVVVFLPIAFLPGVVGKFLVEFGLVVVVATLTSLWTSFTVTPTLAGRWSLKSKWRPWAPLRAFERGFQRARLWYAEKLLPAGLRHPWIVVGISAVSLAGALSLIPLGVIGFEFIPAQDRGELYVQVTYPTGTPLAKTNGAVQRLGELVNTIPDVDVATETAGAYSSPFGGFIQQGAVGQIHVFLKDDRRRSTNDWVQWLRKRAPGVAEGAEVVVIPAGSSGGGNAQPLDYLVTSLQGDPAPYAAKIEQTLKDTTGSVNVTSSAETLSPQVEVIFDRRAAQALNVGIGTASQAIRAAFGGALATQFESPDGLKDVQVIYPVSRQTSLKEVPAIPIRTNNGTIIHVGDIAHLVWAPAPPVITRVNRQSVIHITGNVAPGVAQSNVEKAFQQRLTQLHLPAFVSIHANPNGNQQNTRDTVIGLAAALMLSFALVYLLMTALYNGYVTPFIIMFSVPVATVGALGALALTHQTLNLFSLIGTIMLVGLVTKNGILLVDFANILRERGYGKAAAILESARVRFRPIVMTTVSMIAGMAPLAFALVPGMETRQGLGIVVIGGLASSLLLTLVLVPVVYVWLAPERYDAGRGLEGEEKRIPGLELERGGMRQALPTE